MKLLLRFFQGSRNKLSSSSQWWWWLWVENKKRMSPLRMVMHKLCSQSWFLPWTLVFQSSWIDQITWSRKKQLLCVITTYGVKEYIDESIVIPQKYQTGTTKITIEYSIWNRIRQYKKMDLWLNVIKGITLLNWYKNCIWSLEDMRMCFLRLLNLEWN